MRRLCLVQHEGSGSVLLEQFRHPRSCTIHVVLCSSDWHEHEIRGCAKVQRRGKMQLDTRRRIYDNQIVLRMSVYNVTPVPEVGADNLHPAQIGILFPGPVLSALPTCLEFPADQGRYQPRLIRLALPRPRYCGSSCFSLFRLSGWSRGQPGGIHSSLEFRRSIGEHALTIPYSILQVLSHKWPFTGKTRKPKPGTVVRGSAGRTDDALPGLGFTRSGRTPGVPGPACGSARRRRWPPRSPDAGPCGNGAHRRSPA